MVWQFIKRHRRKLFVLSLITGGGYAAFKYINGKLQSMMNEQDKMLVEWKKQLYYEHNRDTSLRTSKILLNRIVSFLLLLLNIVFCFLGTDIFAQVVVNINRTFQCENILNRLSTTIEFVLIKILFEI